MCRLVVIPVFLLLSACATDLTLHAPYAQIETPEASGAQKGISLGFGVTPGKEIQVVDDAQSRPPVYAQVIKHATADPYGKAIFGFAKRFDLGLQHLMNANTTFGTAKFQILGNGALTGTPGLLLAVYGRYGQGGDKESGDQMSTFGNGGYPWQGKAGMKIAEYGASLGYRFGSDMILFAGYSQNTIDAYANVDHDRSATGDKPEAHYSQVYEGKSRSIGVGLSFGKKSRFSFHAVGTEFEWSDMEKLQDIQGGAEYIVNVE